MADPLTQEQIDEIRRQMAMPTASRTGNEQQGWQYEPTSEVNIDGRGYVLGNNSGADLSWAPELQAQTPAWIGYDRDPATYNKDYDKSVLNGTQYDKYDATGENIGQGTWEGLTKGDKQGEFWKALAFAVGAPLAGAAMTGTNLIPGVGFGAAGGPGSAGWGMGLDSVTGGSGALEAMGGAAGAGEAAAAGAGEMVNGAFLGESAWTPTVVGDAATAAGEVAATAGEAGSTLSKAALDGTNIFGANSVPGALDISALSGAGTSVEAAKAVGDIATSLGYTGPSTLTSIGNFIKDIPGGINKLVSGLGGMLGGGGIESLLPLLMLMGLLDKGGGGGGGGSQAKIPAYKANRGQTPYAQQRPAGSRPGGGGVDYFNRTSYTPMAAGGIAALAPGYGGGGEVLSSRQIKGPGDGVSDSIPHMIDGAQPAALASDEFVVDARAVAELGNGSSEAGAKELYAMVDRIHGDRKKAGVGKDSRATRHLPA